MADSEFPESNSVNSNNESQQAGTQPNQEQQSVAQEAQPTPEQPFVQPSESLQAAPVQTPDNMQQVQQCSPDQVVYKSGCVGAAWQDIKNSKGWFGKIALMGLIEFIPILNWVNAGYAMRWGRDLYFGRVEEMPKSIFVDRAFVNGAMCFVIQILISLVTLIASFMLSIVPLIGWLVALAFSIFTGILYNAMTMRTAIFDELGAGLSISQVWSGVKGHFGSLFAIWILPMLIIGLISFCICSIIAVIGGTLLGTNLFAYIGNLVTSYGGTEALSAAISRDPVLERNIAFALVSYLGALLPILIVCGYVTCASNVLAQLLAFRATGHFCVRWAGEWRDDPRFDYVLHRERI